ncbi:MAG: hypothetical protein ACK41T_00080 [Pseudobdellovibrio sp.]
MNIWLLLLTFFNIVLLAGLSFSLFLRIKEKQEDQRITKGLQLLQNKISILEDLSDKTDEQVHKLVHLIDQKTIEIRNTLNQADEMSAKIKHAIDNGIETSKKIIEQAHANSDVQNSQKTINYVTAAKMAHQGHTLDEISAHVDLSPAEIQMIIKVNRDNLQFAEDQLPEWMKLAPQSTKSTQQTEIDQFAAALNQQNSQFSSSKLNTTLTKSAFDSVRHDLTAQNSLTESFKKTIQTVPQSFSDTEEVSTHSLKNQTKTIKPFEFKRITAAR